MSRTLPASSLDANALGDGRTIAAIATAPGRGALAIVRISGSDVAMIAATHAVQIHGALGYSLAAAVGGVAIVVVIFGSADPIEGRGHGLTG